MINQDKIMESQEYLRKVGEAIKKRELSLEEAVFASSLKQRELGVKLHENKPFGLRTSASFTMREETSRSVELFTEPTWKRETLVLPKHAILKTNKKISDQQASSIFDSELENDKLFRFYDVLGFRVMTKEQEFEHKHSKSEFNRDLRFHMLNWKDNNYVTPVDQKLGIVREDEQRLKAWQQIHNTIECIAADTMKEKGITF